MLLGHWERRAEVKHDLSGAGSDFRKLKYPFVWYDILHVTDLLSRYPFAHADPRFGEMVAAITAQADADGRHAAGSMYQAWRGWSFADKQPPSPWLTFLTLRIHRRVRGQGQQAIALVRPASRAGAPPTHADRQRQQFLVLVGDLHARTRVYQP